MQDREFFLFLSACERPHKCERERARERETGILAPTQYHENTYAETGILTPTHYHSVCVCVRERERDWFSGTHI